MGVTTIVLNLEERTTSEKPKKLKTGRLNLSLAKVSGALRCNRWSKGVSSTTYRDGDDSFLPDMEKVFRNAKDYLNKLNKKYSKKPQYNPI